ncbi:hypothetical protein [Nitratireductor thuwali]|uniref:DUF4175 domain-containing protein n=1 Tax=Nitratireductor thuwali TaxID=2267699 RepID=A0ABY5MIN2_9HYPH|nr:hypothetical protein NTH_02331 [Nitratireductor thuwali]
MFLSAFLSIIGLGFLCWLLFNLAIYALPCFVAITVGYYAFENGVGTLGAIALALFAGATAFILGQVAFAAVRSPVIRLLLGALYALPAGVAGFQAVKGLSETGGGGEPWTLVFASVGAAVVGIAAWMRVTSLAGADARQAPRKAAVRSCYSDLGR